MSGCHLVLHKFYYYLRKAKEGNLECAINIHQLHFLHQVCLHCAACLMFSTFVKCKTSKENNFVYLCCCEFLIKPSSDIPCSLLEWCLQKLSTQSSMNFKVFYKYRSFYLCKVKNCVKIKETTQGEICHFVIFWHSWCTRIKYSYACTCA